MCDNVYEPTVEELFWGLDSPGVKVLEISLTKCLMEANSKIKHLEAENTRMDQLCNEQIQEVDKLKELCKSKDEQIELLDSQLRRHQSQIDDNQVLNDLKSKLNHSKKRTSIMNDWYDYLIEENHQLQDKMRWLDDQLHHLEEVDHRRERFLEERCKQSEYINAKHRRLLNKTSLLEAHVEGLCNERDVFDDLRAIVEQYKQTGLKSVLKKDKSCSKHSHQVRFNDEANTVFIFDCRPTGDSDSYSDKSSSEHSHPVRFNDEANTEVIFDRHPPGDSKSDSDKSSSKPSHPVRFNYEANAEIIFDCRPSEDSESDSDSQNEFHAGPKRESALTKSSLGDTTVDSGYSSGVDFEDCV